MKVYRIITCVFVILVTTACIQVMAQDQVLKRTHQKQKKDSVKSVISVQPFDEFWKEFREAVITQNKEKVADMTWFPLEISGDLDGSIPDFVRRPQFIKLEFYRIFIETDFEGKRELIERVKANSTVSAPEEEIKNGLVSFYNLDFRLVQGKWKLVNVYQPE